MGRCVHDLFYGYHSSLNEKYDDFPGYTRNYKMAQANCARRNVLNYELADEDNNLIEDLIGLCEQSEERP